MREAQQPARQWRERLETDGEPAYRTCPRGDWLLAAVADRVPRARLVAAALACAELVADLLPNDEHRPAAARDAARAFVEGRGETDRGASLAAADAAMHDAVDAAAAAAAQSSWAALRAVEVPEDAPLAAAAAIRALVLDVGECGVASARGYAEHATAERVRAAVPWTTLGPR